MLIKLNSKGCSDGVLDGNKKQVPKTESRSFPQHGNKFGELCLPPGALWKVDVWQTHI